MIPVSQKFLFSSFAYGFARKLIQMRNATLVKESYNAENNGYDKTYTPVLFVDKVCITCVSSLMTPFLWPIYMYQDAKALELHMKNMPQESEYKYLIDYFL